MHSAVKTLKTLASESLITELHCELHWPVINVENVLKVSIIVDKSHWSCTQEKCWAFKSKILANMTHSKSIY